MVVWIVFLGMILAGSAFAAEPEPSSSYPPPSAPPSPAATAETEAPLRVNTAEQLQWKPEDQALEAIGNVNLAYKGFVLQAHRARLMYQTNAQSPASTTAPAMENIRAFDLQGGVVFKNPLYEITCQRAHYQIADQRLRLTGDPVVIKNAEDTAKIWGTLTVDLANARVDGVGPVHLSRKSYDIRGQDLTMIFLPWDISRLQDATLDTASLLRDVVLTYPQLKVTSNQGLFDAAGQTVTLTSNVIITRDSSVIHTEKAVLDLTTRRVRLSSPNQPVTGKIHVPDFEHNNTQSKETP